MIKKIRQALCQHTFERVGEPEFQNIFYRSYKLVCYKCNFEAKELYQSWKESFSKQVEEYEKSLDQNKFEELSIAMKILIKYGIS